MTTGDERAAVVRGSRRKMAEDFQSATSSVPAGSSRHRPAALLQPGHERAGQHPGAALRHRPADVLAERAEDEAEEAADRRLRRQVGVQRAAGDQPRAPAPAKCSSSKRRTDSVASRAIRSGPKPRSAAPSAAWRERRRRRHEQVEPAAPHATPERVERPPCVAVARANESSDAAVSSRSRESTTHEPSPAGCASTSGPWRQRSPCCSRPSDRIAGDAAASG